ncbi:MAG: T9SS type B sorting domain-containing protein, partial [Bacteroidota bacterium]
CDSVATLILNVSAALSSTTNTTICTNQLPYTWNGQTYNAAGTYTKTLIAASGCDSIATLVLTVTAAKTSTTSITVCNNQLPYQWNGQFYSLAGTYSVTLTAASGCDSVATLLFNINNTGNTTTNITICPNQLPYTWNGQTYTTAGTYSVTLSPVPGCTYVATLVLTVNTMLTSTTNTTICTNQLPYTWNGQTLTAAGTYNASLTTASGCDSVATLVLTVNATKTSTTTIAICNSQLPYTWNGQTYTTAGIYTKTLIAASGCDSVASLVLSTTAAANLLINDPPSVCEPNVIDLSQASITAGSDPALTYSYWADAAASVPLVNPLVNATGTYYIKGSSAAGCTAVKPVLVTVEKKIDGIRYTDVIASPNTPQQLQARSISTNDSYLWTPSIGLNSAAISNPIFSYDQETEYRIAISTQAGCVTVDTLQVIFNIVAPAPAADIFIPKAWTPNSDGHNDNLVPLTLNISSIKYFRLFNRWGQLVFETNVIGKGWDGRYRGIPQPVDTYTWIVEATAATGEKILRTGTAVLLR